jgi:aspartyl-tRNA(Asn)/glutamyl-tRNA(Gln) amidotransferase subunit A
MNLLEAAAALRSRQVSSRELTAQALEQIAKLNPKLNAFVTVTADLAMTQAAEADANFVRDFDHGPLQGIPIALKDVFETKGIRTTCGSKLFADHVPTRDSAVTERLARVGAVMLGKTGMHELAYGVTSNNPHFGPVRNPWNPECIPGGSSGGSGSAVAAGMCYMAMGSDTGGSIRLPASFCGTVGIKPTTGRVSRYGVMPLDFSLDHMGPLTRTVRDAAVVLEALAGYDPRDDSSSRHPAEPYLPPAQVSLAGVRIGVPENYYFDAVDPAAEKAVRAMAGTARKLGATVEPVRVPDMPQYNVVSRIILLSEASALMERHLHRREDFGADVLALLDQGRFIPATDYLNAQRLRRVMQCEFAQVWTKTDFLFTPTTPTGAPRIGQTTIQIAGRDEDVRLASTRMVRAINLLGLPALSLPCGFDAAGMPLGLQIIGRPFDEAGVFRVAAALEDTLSPSSPPLAE